MVKWISVPTETKVNAYQQISETTGMSDFIHILSILHVAICFMKHRVRKVSFLDLFYTRDNR
jgi:hypothetical protein